MSSIDPKDALPDPMPISVLDSVNTDAATLARRFVRVTQRQPNGLVAFEFSVGWPDMSVELVLQHYYKSTCQTTWETDVLE
jgi:phenol hydroxylase P0 protein